MDWRKLEPEILSTFTTLLKIDTSNPPGKETLAANAIQSILERGGIQSRLFALDPERANLVARIKGTGKKKPLLIMGHTDVVGVQREKWTVDPFAAVNKNGVIYARGARDDKPHVVAGIMILLLLKRMNIQLDRDVIFLAEAGEEGTSTFGIDYMVKEHWPEIEAEYAIAEGGSIVEENGKPHHILISNTEKSPQRIRLVAHGPAGHGSRPDMANAVVHLAAGRGARRQLADPHAARGHHPRLLRAPGARSRRLNRRPAIATFSTPPVRRKSTATSARTNPATTPSCGPRWCRLSSISDSVRT